MLVKFRKPKFTKDDATIPIGVVSAGIINGPAHEGGHYLAARTLGYNPSFGYGHEVIPSLITYIDRLPESVLHDNIITLGAPATEYVTAFVLSALSKKIKNRFLRTGAKMTSTFLGMAPFAYSLLSYLTESGDYQRLAQNGIGYEIAIPSTLVMGLTNAYVAWRKNL